MRLTKEERQSLGRVLDNATHELEGIIMSMFYKLAGGDVPSLWNEVRPVADLCKEMGLHPLAFEDLLDEAIGTAYSRMPEDQRPDAVTLEAFYLTAAMLPHELGITTRPASA